MILCPDCNAEMADAGRQECVVCGWTATTLDGVPIYLSNRDRTDPFCAQYVQSYEELAAQNLVKSNIDRRYLHNQAKRVLTYIGDVAGKEICDLGTGQGFLTTELAKRNPVTVTTVDVSISYLKRFVNMEGIRPILAKAENLPFADAFDILVSTDVMEHVVDLGSFLFCVNRAVRPGGLVCIRVPYMKTVVHHSRFLGYPYRFGHLRSFDEKILRMLMETAGFSVRRLHKDGFVLSLPRQIFFKRKSLRYVYDRIHGFLTKRLDHPFDIALWNATLCRMMLIPNEIVVVGRKIKRIKKLEPQGYQLEAIVQEGAAGLS